MVSAQLSRTRRALFGSFARHGRTGACSRPLSERGRDRLSRGTRAEQVWQVVFRWPVYFPERQQVSIFFDGAATSIDILW